MSKSYFRIVLCLIATLFAACNNDNDNTPKIVITDGGQQTLYASSVVAWFTFTADAEWQMFAPDAWVQIVEDQNWNTAPGNHTVYLKLEPNFSGKDRSASVILRSRQTEERVTLTQSAYNTEGKVPDPYYLLTRMYRYVDPATRTSPMVPQNVTVTDFYYNDRQQLTDVSTYPAAQEEHPAVSGFYYDYSQANTINLQRKTTLNGGQTYPTGTFNIDASGYVSNYKYIAFGTTVDGALQYTDGYLTSGTYTSASTETGTQTVATTATYDEGNLTLLTFGSDNNPVDNEHNRIEMRYSNASLINSDIVNLDLNYLLDQTGFVNSLPLCDNFYLKAGGYAGKRSRCYMTEQRDGLDGTIYSFLYRTGENGLPEIVEVNRNNTLEGRVLYQFTYQPIIRKGR
ncbi:MAG: BACON domain-containing protein [Prevotellaceae bacterium]|jgi:hypothetical protein|nr:BACON domain-containing protein [Prevotellaceae bacterium]